MPCVDGPVEFKAGDASHYANIPFAYHCRDLFLARQILPTVITSANVYFCGHANHGQPAWTHPVIPNGKLCLRDQEKRLCYDVKAKERNPFA
jgi:hypothetical protein